MHSRLIQFLLLPPLLLLNVINGDKPGQPEEGAWLMMTQVLTRHGDRSAQDDIYITKAADKVFFRGHGELSSEGIDNARKTGKAYRNAYVNNSHFIDGRLIPKEVKFQGSDVNRVLMTAGAFASGLFKDEKVNGEVIPPIYSTPYDDDTLLAINFNCTLGWDDMAAAYNITNTTNMPNKILASMRDKDWKCISPPSSQSDTIIAEYENSRTKDQLDPEQINCGNEEGESRKFMYKYIEALGGSGTNETDARIRLQRTIGRLATEIINNFKERVHCYSWIKETCDPVSEKATFYFAHDVNLLALMNVFSMQAGSMDFFKGKTPAFSASLSMELWVKNDVQYVKMFAKNGVNEDFEEFDFCGFLPTGEDFSRVGKYCTLRALENAKNIYIDTDEIVCN